jgi:hypothetical protein
MIEYDTAVAEEESGPIDRDSSGQRPWGDFLPKKPFAAAAAAAKPLARAKLNDFNNAAILEYQPMAQRYCAF